MTYNSHYFVDTYFPSYFQTVRKTERLDRWVACGWVAPGWIAGRPCDIKADTAPAGVGKPLRFLPLVRIIPLKGRAIAGSTATARIIGRLDIRGTSTGASSATAQILLDSTPLYQEETEAVTAWLLAA